MIFVVRWSLVRRANVKIKPGFRAPVSASGLQDRRGGSGVDANEKAVMLMVSSNRTRKITHVAVNRPSGGEEMSANCKKELVSFSEPTIRDKPTN